MCSAHNSKGPAGAAQQGSQGMPTMAHTSFNTVISGTRPLHPKSGKWSCQGTRMSKARAKPSGGWNCLLPWAGYKCRRKTACHDTQLCCAYRPSDIILSWRTVVSIIKPARLNFSLPFSFMWLFMPVLCDSFRLYQSLFHKFLMGKRLAQGVAITHSCRHKAHSDLLRPACHSSPVPGYFKIDKSRLVCIQTVAAICHF